MSNEHEHEHGHHHGHDHGHEAHSHAPAPVSTDDAGSQALEEALRSSFVIVKIAMVLMVVVFLGSGFFTVGPQEKAVILRFGKPVGDGEKALLSAGLHWSLPYPIDEVVRIPVVQLQSMTSSTGWWYTTPEQEMAGDDTQWNGQQMNAALDGYMISADRNIVHLRATVNFSVVDPLRYMFGFTSASNVLQNAINNALISTAAKFSIDDILVRNQQGFADAVLQRVTELVDQDKLGISLAPNIYVVPKPPRQLAEIFNQVTTARENRDKQLNDARSYENRVISEADAQAVTITNLAAADRDNYVKSLKAEAKRFNDLLPQFTNYPGLFAQQQVVAALGQVLTNVQDKFFLPEREDGKSRELRLMLNREPVPPRTGTNTP